MFNKAWPTRTFPDCDALKKASLPATVGARRESALNGNHETDDTDMKSPKENSPLSVQSNQSNPLTGLFVVPDAVFVHRVMGFITEEEHFKARLTCRVFNNAYTRRTYHKLGPDSSRRVMKAGTEARHKVRASGLELKSLGPGDRPCQFLNRFVASLLEEIHLSNYVRLNLESALPESLPNLRELHIFQCGVVSLAAIGRYPLLTGLFIKKNSHRTLDLSTLPVGSVIRELELGHCGLTNLGALKRISPSLGKLTLEGNRHLQVDTLPPNMPQLRTLKIQHMMGGGVQDASHLECYAETLECLLLPYNRNLKIMSLPQYMPRLWWLNVGQCGLSDVSELRHFAGTLERLVLFGNNLDLRTLPKLPKLREMCLEGTGLRDASPLERFSSTIETISLSHNRRLEFSTLALVMPSMHRLKLMNLVDCGIDESALDPWKVKLVNKNFSKNWKINFTP